MSTVATQDDSRRMLNDALERGDAVLAARLMVEAAVGQPSPADHGLHLFLHATRGAETRLTEAIAAELAAAFPGHAKLQLVASQLARRVRANGAALQRARAALAAPDRRGTDLAELNLNLAQSLVLANDAAAALDLAQPLLTHARHRVEATITVIDALILRGRAGEAVQLAREVVERRPDSSTSWEMLIRLLRDTGDFAAAAAAVAEARLRIRFVGELRFTAAAVLLATGEVDAALSLVDQAIAEEAARSQRLDLRLEEIRVRALIAAGRLPDARDAVIGVARRSPPGRVPLIGIVAAQIEDRHDRQAFKERVLAESYGGTLPLSAEPDRPVPLRIGGGTARVLFPAENAADFIHASIVGQRPEDADFIRRLMARVQRLDLPPHAIGMTTFEAVDVFVDRHNFLILHPDGQVSDTCWQRPVASQYALAMAQTPIRTIDEAWLIFGTDDSNFAHWVVDWCAQIAAAAATLPGCPIVLPPLREPRFQANTLGLFGLDKLPLLRLEAGRYRFRKVHVLDSATHRGLRHCLMYGNRAYAAPLLARRPTPTAERGLRLFFDRPPPERRHIINRGPVLKMMAAHGYQLIDAGRLPSAEQAALAASATHIVGVHGAALANLLFCAPGTRVLEIHSPDMGTMAFATICSVVGAAYRPVVGRSALPPQGHQWTVSGNLNYIVPPDALQQGLDWLHAG